MEGTAKLVNMENANLVDTVLNQNLINSFELGFLLSAALSLTTCTLAFIFSNSLKSKKY